MTWINRGVRDIKMGQGWAQVADCLSAKIFAKNMSFQTFFHHNVSYKGGVSEGMDTPVWLISRRVQVTFLGNISDRRLQGMTRRKNPLIIATIKWVLGEDFISNPDRYRVNTDICSRFLASLLDYGQSRLLTTQLTQALFPLDYLGGLEDVVAYHVPFLGLPVTSDLERFIFQNEEVRWHPLINGLKTMSLSSHRYRVELAVEFLLWVHMMVPIPEATEWYTSFRDYIFPRVLLPD